MHRFLNILLLFLLTPIQTFAQADSTAFAHAMADSISVEKSTSDTTTEVVGKLNLVTFEPKEINICLVPVNDVEHVFTQPGCPTQNSYVERFNGSYRRGVLDAYLFRTLQDVRDITEKWQLDYNTTRPHEALGNMTPMEYYEMKMKSSLVGTGAPAPCCEAIPERDFS